MSRTFVALLFCALTASFSASAVTKRGTKDSSDTQSQKPATGETQASPLVPAPRETNNFAAPAAKPIPSTVHIERGPLGLALRRISRETGANLVLMSGVEEFRTGPFDFQNKTPAIMVKEAIAPAEYNTYLGTHYTFVAPPGYEALNAWEMGNRLAELNRDNRVDFFIGGGTPLYSALALLGHSLSVTLVADNAIAESLAGEINLHGATLDTALEALLRSCRIVPGTVNIETGPGYAFIYSKSNSMAANPMLNTGSLPGAIATKLSSPVSFTLPQAITSTSEIQGRRGATPLQEVLPTLRAQLGIPVTATADAGRLPVNPMAVRGVTAMTALDLVVRQWLVPAFGYEVTESGVHFRRR